MTIKKVGFDEAADASDSVPSKAQKQKLTLGINREVVEKAKAAGINISEITEQLLTAMTYEPKGNTNEDVMKAYQVFLDAIRGILNKYGTSIAVGEVEYADDPEAYPTCDIEDWTFYLGQKGLWKSGIKKFVDESQEPLTDEWVEVSQLLPYMYEPKRILENLIKALTSAAEYNKERLTQLDFAMRLVQTLKEENLEERKK